MPRVLEKICFVRIDDVQCFCRELYKIGEAFIACGEREYFFLYNIVY